jgi:hypothetical protein
MARVEPLDKVAWTVSITVLVGERPANKLLWRCPGYRSRRLPRLMWVSPNFLQAE